TEVAFLFGKGNFDPHAGEKKVGVISQSSVYEGQVPATAATLTDGDLSTGSGTNSTAADWIQSTFSKPVTVTAVLIGGGNLAGWGAVPSYFSGAKLQYSNDGLEWNTVRTIDGLAEQSNGQLQRFVVPYIPARMWRFVRANYIALTELAYEFGEPPVCGDQ